MKKHGCAWWFYIGWWWRPITLPFWLPVMIFKRARKRLSGDEGGQTQSPEEPTQQQDGGEVTQVPEPKKETHKVAGVSFRQDALKALGTKNPDFAKTKKQLLDEDMIDEWVYEYIFAPEKVELIPDPDNPYSENGNATKVVVDGQHIGYIKSGSSAHVRKLIEADRIQQVSCFIGGGKSKMVTRDEDDERYIMETDEIGFYARLTITTKPKE